MTLLTKDTAPSRPTLFDYLLILAGFSLSLFLLRLRPWGATEFEARAGLPPPVRDLVAELGDIMRLTEGVVLLWPLFLALQSLRGRGNRLTVGEWLWVIAWLCVVVLTAWAAWEKWGTLPDWLKDCPVRKPRWIYYMFVAPSLGALALLFALAGIVSRGGTPWTHPFSLALVSWPVLPLAGILTLAK